MNALAPLLPVSPKAATTVRVVTAPEELRRLVTVWQELLDDSAAAEPMCAPAWLLTWWDIYGKGRELCVGLFYEGEQLVGLAPLCRRMYRYRPGIPFRRIEFLGSDVDEQDGVCSEYLGLIVRRGHESHVVPTFAKALHGDAFGAWDECVLAALDGNAPLSAALTAALPRPEVSIETTQSTVAPFVTLPATWDEYLRSFKKKTRQSLTYALRDFHEWAGSEWTLHVAKSADEVAHGLSILKDLHAQRWQADGRDGAFASPRFQAFHDRYADKAIRDGRLLLMWVMVRGAPVAALYGIVTDRKVYFYQCGRSLTAPAKVRLGIVAVIFAMQCAIERGLSEFDFLGGAAQYKQLFASTVRPICEIRLARHGIRESARLAAKKIVRLGRALSLGLAGMSNRLMGSKRAQHGPDVPSSPVNNG